MTQFSHKIISSKPAIDSDKGWENQSYPIGNGYFGVSTFGGVPYERLQITENSFQGWHNLTNALEIRINLHGDNHTLDNATDYQRSLELENALQKVSYHIGDVAYTREAFTSYPDRILALKYNTTKEGALSFDIKPEIPFLHPFGEGEASKIGRDGKIIVSEDKIEIIQHLQYYNVKFYALIKVLTDGEVSAVEDKLEVQNASEATIYFSCATNYKLEPKSFEIVKEPLAKQSEIDAPEPNVAATVRKIIANGLATGYDELKKRHIADFSGLMNRATIKLPDSENDIGTETTALLANLREEKISTYLEETFFQYGRYLLISSSRPGTLPPNLQGTWTVYDKTPWGAGYWHNINLQMNYWPAFITNLTECFEAYAEFNEAFRAVTRKFVDAFLKNHNLGEAPTEEESPDIWCIGTAVYPYEALSGPGAHSGPGTGGLTTKLFADWWDYTHDEKALRRFIWPVIHGMADFLTRCVRMTDGKWLSAFSASPEQIATEGGVWDWGKSWKPPYYITVGCAFDQQMIWENNNDLLRLAKILGIEDAVVAKVKEQIDLYEPVIIGDSGQIKEYREEKKYGEIGEYAHRHISQLVGLHPGTLINATRPEWIEAAKYTLNERGDKSTGWALAHRMNCWARLGDGNRSLKLLRTMLKERTYENLWDAHPPYQIDGNFGATSAVAEMLLQSQAGYIDLLPALPDAWASKGAFKGLCARGGYVVDCEWENGKPTSVKIRSTKGTTPEVRFHGKEITDWQLADYLTIKCVP